MNKNKLKRAIAAMAFSLLMAFVLFLAGFLAGNYLWSRFGPPANDPDETSSLFFGILIGGFLALGGFGAILRVFWPRSSPVS